MSAPESQVCAPPLTHGRLGLWSFRAAGSTVTNLSNGPGSCLDPCSEQQVFRCTTNTLIK